MSLEILKNDLKSAQLRRLYYIHGKEPYLKYFYAGQIKRILLSDDPDKIDLIELNGADLTAEDMAEAMQTLPVVCEKKLIIVTDVDFNSSGAAWLQDNPNVLDGPTVTVFFDSTERVRADGSPLAATAASKRFNAFIKKYGLDVKIDSLDQRTLTAWISKQARLRKRTISEDTALYLASCVGTNMFRLIGEIGKLCAYCEHEISKQAVDDICVKTQEAKLYELTDCLLNANAVKAMFVLDALLSMKTEPIVISAAMGTYAANIYRVKLQYDAGESIQNIAEKTGMRDFVVKKILNRLGTKSERDIAQALDACARSDFALKSYSVDSEAVLTQQIMHLMALFK